MLSYIHTSQVILKTIWLHAIVKIEKDDSSNHKLWINYLQDIYLKKHFNSYRAQKDKSHNAYIQFHVSAAVEVDEDMLFSEY